MAEPAGTSEPPEPRSWLSLARPASTTKSGPGRPKRVTPEGALRAQTLRLEGRTWREVGRALGWPAETARRAVYDLRRRKQQMDPSPSDER